MQARLLPTPWGDECVSLIQSFFGTVLEHIQVGRHAEAIAVLRFLREPNETHLGLSEDQARGRGLGGERAQELWRALTTSRAAQTGLLTDLEDTILMIDGVRADIVSGITTNIIRAPLIEFTVVVIGMVGVVRPRRRIIPAKRATRYPTTMRESSFGPSVPGASSVLRAGTSL